MLVAEDAVMTVGESDDGELVLSNIDVVIGADSESGKILLA